MVVGPIVYELVYIDFYAVRLILYEL